MPAPTTEEIVQAVRLLAGVTSDLLPDGEGVAAAQLPDDVVDGAEYYAYRCRSTATWLLQYAEGYERAQRVSTGG